jgi:Sulfate permease and related transporters (MFS superfamily)
MSFRRGEIVSVSNSIFTSSGFVVEFVSLPVVSGFTSSTAIIMASSQLKYFLGIQFKPKNFLDMYVQLFKNIGKTKYSDLSLGVACVVLLLFMKVSNGVP